MVGKLITSNFIRLSVIFFITFSTTNVHGYKNCRSTSIFERDTICRDSEYCCGPYQNKCCNANSSSFESRSDRAEAIATVIVLAVLIGCPLCCCWCCCRKRKNPGVIYNPVAAAVPPTAGGSQLPSQCPAEAPPAMKTPYPLQPNPFPQQAPYPGQQPPYPSQQIPYPGQQPPYPGQQPPYPGQLPPYPGQQPSYPLQPMPYPGQAPYNSPGVMLYPAPQPPYPTHPAPYPPQQTPYPPNPALYPPQSAQQTLSPSGLESLYPPQEATNPFFKMPPPAYNEAMQQAAPVHVETGAQQPPTAPPP